MNIDYTYTHNIRTHIVWLLLTTSLKNEFRLFIAYIGTEEQKRKKHEYCF